MEKIITREIRIQVTSPIECTEEQFEEWVRFSFGNLGGCSSQNPLCEYDAEAKELDIY